MNGPINVLSQHFPIVLALAPDADRYNGNPATDVISMKNALRCTFLLQEGAGGTGTVKITAEACDDFVPTNTVEIPFKYRVASNSGTLTDQFGAVTDAAVPANGYTTVAGANKMVEVIIDAEDLPDGYTAVRLKLTEVANDPCDAGVIAILHQVRHRSATQPTVLA